MKVQNVDSLKKVDGKSIERRIYDEIHAAIANLRLSPGTKLVEESLADVFGVSRARLRNVLLLLAKEQIVKLEPNRGAYVAEPSIEEARQVLAARRVIEDAVLRGAITHVTADDIEKLRRVVDAEKQARAREDRGACLKLTGEFHVILAEACGNPILSGFLKELISRCYLILAIYERPLVEGCSQMDHRILIEQLEAGDPDRAAEQMRLHFDNIESQLDLTPPEIKKVSFHEIFSDFSKQRRHP